MVKVWETEFYLAPSMFGQKLNRMKKFFTLIAPIAIAALASCSREAEVTPNNSSKTVPSEMKIEFAEDFSITDDAKGDETSLDLILNDWGVYRMSSLGNNKYNVKTIHSSYQDFTLEVISTSENSSRIAIYGGTMANSYLFDAAPGEVSVAVNNGNSTSNPFTGNETFEDGGKVDNIAPNQVNPSSAQFRNYFGYRLAAAAATNPGLISIAFDENNTLVNFPKIRVITECGRKNPDLNFTAAVFNATRDCMDDGFTAIRIIKVRKSKWCTDLTYDCVHT